MLLNIFNCTVQWLYSSPLEFLYCKTENLSPYCQPLATTFLLYFSLILTTLGTHMCGIAQYLSFCAGLISLNIIFPRFMCNVVLQDFFLFKGCMIFHCMYTTFPLSMHLSCQWPFRLLSLLGYCKECCSEYGYVNISLRYYFEFFWIYIPRAGIAGSYGNTVF